MKALNLPLIGAGILLVAGLLVASAMADPNPPVARANGVEGTALNYQWGSKIIQSLGMPSGPGGLVLSEQTRVVIDGPQPDSVTVRVMTRSLGDRLELTPAGSANDFALRVERPGRWTYLLVTAQYPGDEYVEWAWTVGVATR